MFCQQFALDPLNISDFFACAFVEFLAAYLSSPKSIQNYISSVREYLLRCGIPNSSFSTHWVSKELDFHIKNSEHQVKRMLPLSDYNVKVLLSMQYHPAVNAQLKLAMAFMYYLGFRQSEVAPYTVNSFRPSKHLTRQDVALVGNYLWIHQRWAKNLQNFDKDRELFLPRSQDPHTCPYQLFKNAIEEVPSRFHMQPFIVFPDYNPITTSFLTQHIRGGMSAIGLDPDLHSLHSFRRSAATHAYEAGFTSQDVQRFGGWAGDSHELYIRSKAQVKVSKHLIDNIAAIDISAPPGNQPTATVTKKAVNQTKNSAGSGKRRKPPKGRVT